MHPAHSDLDTHVSYLIKPPCSFLFAALLRVQRADKVYVINSTELRGVWDDESGQHGLFEVVTSPPLHEWRENIEAARRASVPEVIIDDGKRRTLSAEQESAILGRCW